MSKIFISGPVTGTDDYRERFSLSESYLNRIGHKNTINPVEFCWSLPENTTWEQYLLMGFALLSQCDTIYMMRGWQDSKGARAERDKAIEEGKNIIYEENEIRRLCRESEASCSA